MFQIPRIRDLQDSAQGVDVGTFTVISPDGREIGRLSSMGGENDRGPKEEGDSYDEGPSYALQLQEIVENATELQRYVKNKSDVPAWVQNKITLSNHNIKASLDMYKAQEMGGGDDCGCA